MAYQHISEFMHTWTSIDVSHTLSLALSRIAFFADNTGVYEGTVYELMDFLDITDVEAVSIVQKLADEQLIVLISTAPDGAFTAKIIF